MAIRLLSVGKSSQRVDVGIEVIGDAGEVVDCEGVILGSDIVMFPPVATAADIAAGIVVRAAELYQAGYEQWVLQNEVAVALQGGV